MQIKKIIYHIYSYKYFLYFNKFGFKSYIAPTLHVIKNNGYIETGPKLRIQKGMRMELLDKNSEIIIGENVSIGQNFHITSGGKLLIGSNVTISGNIFITNIDHNYTDIAIPILEQKNIIRETIIGDNCFIGYGACIQSGTKLGKQCIVGANAVVRGEFPDYCVIAGVPAKIIKKYNSKSKLWERVK